MSSKFELRTVIKKSIVTSCFLNAVRTIYSQSNYITSILFLYLPIIIIYTIYCMHSIDKPLNECLRTSIMALYVYIFK